MVRNIKIKTFLIISFVTILALMNLIGMGALYLNGKLADSLIAFYEHPHTVQLQVAEVQLDMAKIGSQIKSAIVYKTPEKTQETTDFISVTMEDMNKRINSVKENFSGPKSLIDAADVTSANWLGGIEQLRILMEAEDYSTATTTFKNVYTPLEAELTASIQAISDDAGTRTLGYYESAKKSKVSSAILILSLDAVSILLTIYLCSLIIRSISIPLKEIQRASDALSKGDLKQTIGFKGNNEFGNLADSMRSTISTLSHYIHNIDEVLDNIAGKDLTKTVDIEYVGDFSPIKTSLQKIISSLHSTMLQINSCSEQVAEGASQVAASTQISSQGSAEQASSVEQLATSIAEISAHVTENAGHTDEANRLAGEVGSQLNSGNEQMGTMLHAISEINNASEQIAKIIKTIEDIAFQTNILALNAAIEAARAGTAGKGFAVVADEVRTLAGKSAEAAKSTTELIKNSIAAVDNGTRIASNTAATLESVVSGAMRITDMISNITDSSALQSTALKQINHSVEQIAMTIQTNAAATEECAATSEEMGSQAQVLDHLVESFKL